MVMWASLAELIINIILSVWFIHIWGITGVAFATIIAYMAQKIIWITYNKSVLGISPKEYIPVKLLTLYSFIALVVYYFTV